MQTDCVELRHPNILPGQRAAVQIHPGIGERRNVKTEGVAERKMGENMSLCLTAGYIFNSIANRVELDLWMQKVDVAGVMVETLNH